MGKKIYISEEDILESDTDNKSETEFISDEPEIKFFELGGKRKIKYIYHMSDIHIRNTQRHQEYLEVFSRLYDELQNQIGSNKKNSLIVLTGDIVHGKTENSPELVTFTYDFIKNLSDIAPVVLIAGNHDCNLSNKHRMDALTPIVTHVGRISNCYYLKDSGYYQLHNIIFGVSSVFDNIFVPADMIEKKVCKDKYLIALYHGAVHGSVTDVGYRMNNTELLVDDFDGYDYVMLGDIHKHQYLNEEKTIAYASSLIQQDHGETLDGHGFIKWNLESGKSKLVEISNDYGYCALKLVNGKLKKKTKIPPKPRIKFILHETSQLQYQEMLEKLNQKYEICEIVKESNFKTKTINKTQKKIKKATPKTQETIIRQYLQDQNIDDEKCETLLKMHKKICKKIMKNGTDNDMGNSQKWKILELKFDNVLSYGKDNIIDFRKFDHNKIIGIFAPNHYGKSAVLDIILFCLFDKFSRGDRRDILNKNKNDMFCSLLFSVGKTEYLIERIGVRSKNGLTVKIDVNFYRKEDDNWEKLNGLDKNDTNKQIIDLVGNYNDYLTTCFCLQHGKNLNFIDLTQLQKKEYLNEILRINIFENCHQYARDKLKGLSAQLKLLEQKVGKFSMDELKKNSKQISKRIVELEEKKSSLINNQMKYIQWIIDTTKQNPLPVYHELSEYTLDSYQNIQKAIECIQSELNEHKIVNMAGIKQDLNDYRNDLENLEELYRKSQSDKKSDGIDYDSLICKKEKFLKKIVQFPDEIKEENLDELLNKQIQLQNKIELFSGENVGDIAKKISECKNEIDKIKKSLQYANPNALENYKQLIEEYKNNKELIVKKLNSAFSSKNLSKEQRNTIVAKKKIVEEFMLYLDNQTKLINKYSSGDNTENDYIISQLSNNQQMSIEKYQQYIDTYHKDLEKTESDYPELLKKSKGISKQIIIAASEMIKLSENRKKEKLIKRLENKLEKFREYEITAREKDLLQKELLVIDLKIKQIKDFIIHQESNDILQNKIIELDRQIKEERDEIREHDETVQILRKKIMVIEKSLMENQNELERTVQLKVHFRLLKLYQLQFITFEQKRKSYELWNGKKNEILENITAIEKELEVKKFEKESLKKDLERYLELRTEFDDLFSQTNLYQSYVQVTNPNGLPYEMLKSYLPMIESDVNQILHAMVGFDIEFMFFDESQKEEQKNKRLKANAGCVDLNICYPNTKPYNVQLASGFERFIINLAIRMTLGQISLTAKPNFLIIDEGWSCLDSDNLNNVSTIMNYLKMQYEHVIIISHLDELKNQADYIINIGKENDFSKVNIENRSRKKSKIIQI